MDDLAGNLTKEKLLFVCKSGRDIRMIFDLNESNLASL